MGCISHDLPIILRISNPDVQARLLQQVAAAVAGAGAGGSGSAGGIPAASPLSFGAGGSGNGVGGAGGGGGTAAAGGQLGADYASLLASMDPAMISAVAGGCGIVKWVWDRKMGAGS